MHNTHFLHVSASAGSLLALLSLNSAAEVVATEDMVADVAAVAVEAAVVEIKLPNSLVLTDSDFSNS